MSSDSSSGSRAGTRFGHYELRALLGKGGMGEVYEAFDTRKQRTVAVKLLPAHLASDPRYTTRFRRESKTAARLSDPHVIPIHDWGEIDGALFIDMRLVEGTSVGAVLRESGPMSPARAVSVIEQVASALDAAHADGLVHRDIKPDNILLTSNDFAYLVDFGIAFSETDTQLTTEGTVIGSYAYMAPERFGPGVTVDGATDIYSLACMLHQMLTGHAPFDTVSIEQVISAHLHSPPPAPSVGRPWVPGAFDAVIARGMAKTPTDRFASAGELARAARAALSTAPTAPPPPPPIPPTVASDTALPSTRMAPPPPPDTYLAAKLPTPSRTGPARVLAALAVVALIVGALGAWALWPHNTDDTPEGAAADTGGAGSPLSDSGSRISTSYVPTIPTTTVGSSVSPRPEPSASRSETPAAVPASRGDLGLSTPITVPSCEGSGIVVLANSTGPGNYATEVAGYLDAYPGARYLRTDQSCPSLRQATDEGNPIYAVYRPAGTTVTEICTAVRSEGGDAYGKWLDTITDPREIVAC